MSLSRGPRKVAPMERWNPWRALRARETARLRFRSVHPSAGRGYVEVRGGLEVITLDHDLTSVERNAGLAHELVHLERGVPEIGCPELLRAKEEAAVRRETARRLVPLDELRSFVAARAELGAVTARDVGEEFEVPIDVALEAMRQVA